MKIEKILSSLKQQPVDGTKVAAAQTSGPTLTVVPSPDSTKTAAPALMGALTEALSAAPGVTKVAAEQSTPVADVMKIANELAATEQEANIKHAQVMGAAFADAFVARVGVWQKTAAELNQLPATKTAAHTTANPAQGSQFQKFAAENPGMIQQAQQLGYEQTKAALEKQAQSAFDAGFEDTSAVIHKTAALEFVKGAQVMGRVLDHIAQQG